MYYWKQTNYNEYTLVGMDGSKEVFCTYEALWHHCKARNINAQLV